MPQPAVVVEGLPQLSRQLRAFGDKSLPKAFRAAGKTAAQLVADAARSAVPKRTGRLAASLRAAGQARGAVVREGSAKVPYAGPVEFGGWPQGRPFVKEGRYIFPAAKEREREVAALFEREVGRVVEQLNRTP